MKCPHCGETLTRSKKDPSYGLCYNCKKRYKLYDEDQEQSVDSVAHRSNQERRDIKRPKQAVQRVEKHKRDNRRLHNNSHSKSEKQEVRFSTARLVIGIISVVLFVLIALQSCAAGVSNALSESNEVSGSAGLLLAVCYIVAGIVSICLRKKSNKTAFIVPAVFYIIGAILAASNVGTYSDLGMWAILASIFGALHLFFMFRSSQANMILSIVIPIVLVAIVSLFVMMAPKQNSNANSGSTTSDTSNENSGSTTSDAENNTTTDEQVTKVEQINMDNSEGTLSFERSEVTTDMDGNPALKVYFTYTNKSESTKSSMELFSPQAFQNGVECTILVGDIDGEEASSNADKEVQQNTSLEVAVFFILQDTSSPVTLKVTDYSEENILKDVFQEQQIAL